MYLPYVWSILIKCAWLFSMPEVSPVWLFSIYDVFPVCLKYTDFSVCLRYLQYDFSVCIMYPVWVFSMSDVSPICLKYTEGTTSVMWGKGYYTQHIHNLPCVLLSCFVSTMLTPKWLPSLAKCTVVLNRYLWVFDRQRLRVSWVRIPRPLGLFSCICLFMHRQLLSFVCLNLILQCQNDSEMWMTSFDSEVWMMSFCTKKRDLLLSRLF